MTTEAETVAKLATEGQGPIYHPSLGLVMRREGWELTDVSKYEDENRGHPARSKGVTRVSKEDAFVELTQRFLDEEQTVVYVEEHMDHVTLNAVINDHGTDKPGFRDHVIACVLPLSPEWREWQSKSEAWLPMAEFAEFIDAQSLDLLDPGSIGAGCEKARDALDLALGTPAAIRGLSRSMTVKVKQVVKDHRVLASGERQVIFAQEHQTEDGAPLMVPGGFAIAIPVFTFGPLYPILARLRYRVSGGAITWSYSLVRTEHVKRDAVGELLDRLRRALACPVVE